MAQFNLLSRCSKFRLVISYDKFISVSIPFSDTYLIDRTNTDLVPNNLSFLLLPLTGLSRVILVSFQLKLRCNLRAFCIDYFLFTQAYTTQTQNGIMFVTEELLIEKDSNG